MSSHMDKLKALNAKTYVDQAKHYLNAYWTEHFEDNLDAREQVWEWTQNMIKLDSNKGARGCSLAEIKAHLFIEKNGDAVTWVDFREVMKTIDVDFDKNMSLTEFIIFSKKLDWKELVGREQVYGKEAQAALDAANAKMDAAKEAMAAAKTAAEESAAAQKAAEKAHKEQLAAEEAVRIGLELIEKEEAKKARIIAKYKAISEDESLGTVKRGKAFQQFKQAEGEDPLPLRKAKLEQGAKVRKAKKVSKLAKKRAAKATVKAEAAAAALAEAEAAFDVASETVQQLAATMGGAGGGTLWFMDRELEEASKFLPKSKQRALKKKIAAQKAALLGKEAPKKKKGKRKGKSKKVSTQEAAAGIGSALKGGKKGLRKTKGKKKKSTVADRAKVTMAIKKTPELKHVETPDDGPSEAVKAAFVADQAAAKDEDATTSEEDE